MKLESVDAAWVIDIFLLLLIGIGPKIALVPFLEVTADMPAATKARIVRKMLITATAVAILLLVRDATHSYAAAGVDVDLGNRVKSGIHALVKRCAARACTMAPSMAGKNVHPHVIRHTTASLLLQAGVDEAGHRLDAVQIHFQVFDSAMVLMAGVTMAFGSSVRMSGWSSCVRLCLLRA